jgi:hypothetical protein
VELKHATWPLSLEITHSFTERENRVKTHLMKKPVNLEYAFWGRPMKLYTYKGTSNIKKKSWKE